MVGKLVTTSHAVQPEKKKTNSKSLKMEKKNELKHKEIFLYLITLL